MTTSNTALPSPFDLLKRIHNQSRLRENLKEHLAQAWMAENGLNVSEGLNQDQVSPQSLEMDSKIELVSNLLEVSSDVLMGLVAKEIEPLQSALRGQVSEETSTYMILWNMDAIVEDVLKRSNVQKALVQLADTPEVMNVLAQRLMKEHEFLAKERQEYQESLKVEEDAIVFARYLASITQDDMRHRWLKSVDSISRGSGINLHVVPELPKVEQRLLLLEDRKKCMKEVQENPSDWITLEDDVLRMVKNCFEENVYLNTFKEDLNTITAMFQQDAQIAEAWATTKLFSEQRTRDLINDPSTTKEFLLLAYRRTQTLAYAKIFDNIELLTALMREKGKSMVNHYEAWHQRKIDAFNHRQAFLDQIIATPSIQAALQRSDIEAVSSIAPPLRPINPKSH